MVTVLVIAACSRGDQGAKPEVPADTDVLACVVRRVRDHALASASPIGTLGTTVDFVNTPLDRDRVVAFLLALAADFERDPPKDPRLPAAAAISRIAFALAHLGAVAEARPVARRARAAIAQLPEADRLAAQGELAFALGHAGEVKEAIAVAGTDVVAKLYAAQGLARSGARDAARALVDEVAPRVDNLGPRGAQVQALIALGDVAAARSMVEAATTDRGAMMVWCDQELMLTKHPDADRILGEDIARQRAAATAATTDNDLLMAGTMWSELVRFRELLHTPGASQSRRELDDWLLAKQDARRELVGSNMVRAAVAKNEAEVTRLRAGLSAQPASLARVELALLGGDVRAALDALEAHQRDRMSLLGEASASSATLVTELATAEVGVWIALAAKPPAKPLLGRFRKLACAPWPKP